VPDPADRRERNRGYFQRKAQRAYEEAEAYLLRAVRADPAAPAAYRILMKLYAHAEAYEQALGVLAAMRLHRPDDPDAWLFLGLAHHNLSDASGAARSFEQALLRMDTGLRAQFTDLSGVLNDEQLAAYHQDPEGFARAFWARRDARLLTLDNERRNEHYARMVYADLFFASGSARGWDTERGDTFVRYGKPNNLPSITSRYGVPQLEGNDSVEKSRIATWVYDDFSLQFEDWVRNGEYIFFDEDEIEARVLRRDLTERYDHEEPGRRVAFPFLASTFKGEAGRTDLYVPYGVPLEGVDPAESFVLLTLATGAFLIDPAGGIASERRTEHGLEMEQVASLTDTRLWIGVHHFSSSAGSRELAVEFETQDRTALGYQREALEIPDFSADSLMLSDILPAYGVEEDEGQGLPGTIVRNGLSIRPAPWGVFSTQQPLYLYFEVYNLVPGAGGATTYDVEAALAPWDDAGSLKRFLRGVFGRERADGVSLGFTIDGHARDDSQYMIMDAREQTPGRYVLAIRITDRATGTVVERSREIHLE
jgi:GWxTD domain-containing protein